MCGGLEEKTWGFRVAPMAVERSIEKMDDLVEKMAVGKWGTPKLHDMVYHILSPLNKNQQN